MKKMGKKLSVIAIIFLLAASPAFSQEIPKIDDLLKGVDDFSKGLANALPFNSTVGLNWSDAYIGQLLELPPHFGIGVTVGVTTMPIPALESITGLIGMDDLPLDILGSIGFPIPAISAEARIGGFFIPFDIGFKFGAVPKDILSNFVDMNSLPIEIDYQLIGFDFRYAIFNPKAMPIKVSVGIGFNYLRGGISAEVPMNLGYSFEAPSNLDNPDPNNMSTYELKVKPPTASLLWENKTLEAKAQVSFPLFIITPYAGIGISYGWSSAGYDIKSGVTYKKDGNEQPLNNQIIGILEEQGMSGLTGNGFGSMVDVGGFNIRAFGGLSLNLFVIRIDVTAMYNFFSQSLGASLGLRFQL